MADDYDEDDARGGSSGKNDEGGIPAGGRILLGVVAAVTIPVTIAITVAALLTVERRRVRSRWWLLWTCVSFAVAVIMSGSVVGWLLQPLRLPVWLLSGFAGLDVSSVLHRLGGNLGEEFSSLATSEFVSAMLGQLLFGLPVGFLITAVYTRVRRFKRQKLGEIEGPEFSDHRPVGLLDKRRANRVARKIRAGNFTVAPTSETKR